MSKYDAVCTLHVHVQRQLGLCTGITTGGFADQSEQRQHFKGDWHRFNVKRKLAGRPVVPEAEFERIVDEQGEVRYWFCSTCQVLILRGQHGYSLMVRPLNPPCMHVAIGVQHIWV